MLFPIRQLLEKRDPPLCIPRTMQVRNAMSLMVETDFSQLPVTDASGQLVGMISEQSVMTTYFHVETAVSLLDLSVDHCVTRVSTLPPEADIFEALNMLRATSALVIVEKQKPIGILTNFDTTTFFRNISEGLVLVEDIETTLREYISGVFRTENQMHTALLRAFGPDRRDPSRPRYAYEQISLGQHIQLITQSENWEQFQRVFEPKPLFLALLEQVCQIRNQLAHFRGELDPMQYSALMRTRSWLENRPRLPGQQAPLPVTPTIQPRATQDPMPPASSPLGNWLVQEQHGPQTMVLSFASIEELNGDPLPQSARQHRSWWSNDYTANEQAESWLRSGWMVEDVDLTKEQVTFKRSNNALMQMAFADMLAAVRNARPGITRAKASPQNWLSFSAGRSGFVLGWTFTGQATLRTELYIDTGQQEANKMAFDALYADKAEIEQEIGAELEWERLDHRRASRIAQYIPGQITDPPDKLAQAKAWGAETMVKFSDTFSRRVRALNLDHINSDSTDYDGEDD